MDYKRGVPAPRERSRTEIAQSRSSAFLALAPSPGAFFNGLLGGRNLDTHAGRGLKTRRKRVDRAARRHKFGPAVVIADYNSIVRRMSRAISRRGVAPARARGETAFTLIALVVAIATIALLAG